MENLLPRIRASRSALSQAHRQVADYVTAHVDRLVFQSVHEVARAAGVSVASVSRLASQMGCRSFKDFKIQLAREMPTPGHVVYEGIAPGDDEEQVVRKVFGGNIKSLQDTLQILDFRDLSRTAQRICAARRVVFFGIGSSGNVAREAALRLAHLDVQAEAYVDSYDILVQAERTARGDVSVGVSHSGRSAITVQALRLCRENGAATVGISNYHPSPLTAVSDTFFTTAFAETRVKAVALSSLLAQLCLFDALYLLVARNKKVLPKADRLNKLTDELLRLPNGPAAPSSKGTR